VIAFEFFYHDFDWVTLTVWLNLSKAGSYLTALDKYFERLRQITDIF